MGKSEFDKYFGDGDSSSEPFNPFAGDIGIIPIKDLVDVYHSGIDGLGGKPNKFVLKERPREEDPLNFLSSVRRRLEGPVTHPSLTGLGQMINPLDELKTAPTQVRADARRALEVAQSAYEQASRAYFDALDNALVARVISVQEYLSRTATITGSGNPSNDTSVFESLRISRHREDDWRTRIEPKDKSVFRGKELGPKSYPYKKL